ncbi:MAG: hypothetical protein JWN85_3866 [Gammaproteobacteria bacterium]|nr:hypothetical protein [Gammaproteobacteria bacterium]
MRVSRLLIVLCALAAPLARGDPLQHEFLLFTSAEFAGTFDRQAPETQVVDEVLKADMLFSLQHGPLKLFGEYLVSDHEGDLERFQLGWQLSDDTIIWVGRYHQPTSVWNHDHHHGQYLQTSITRPAIDEWEDLGGILPQHFTGVLLESSRPVLDAWQLRTAVGAGLAPQLNPEGLQTFNLLHPDSNRRQVGYQARASLHPGEFTESGIGALVADDRLSAVGWNFPPGTGFDDVDLRLYGVFGTYAAAAWKLTATVYYADARLERHESIAASDFIVGCVQAERRFGHELTGFLRWEDSSGAGRSQYIKLFEEFARLGHIAGLRWDFAENQALTLQLSDTHTLNGHFADFRLQWSAAFF